MDNYWFFPTISRSIGKSIFEKLERRENLYPTVRKFSTTGPCFMNLARIVAFQAIDHLHVINFRSSVRRQRSCESCVSSIISAGFKRIVMWSLSIERNISAIYRIIIIHWSARIHDSLYTLFAPKSPLIPDCFVKAAIIHGHPCLVKLNLYRNESTMENKRGN